ncbi:MAG: class I SAM-dependent methyltransferase, partial [Candidatus Micrarchaeota archaeon]
GFECSRVAELTRLSAENGGRKVVVLGSEVGGFGMDQIGALSYIKRMNRNLTVVYISEELNQNTARIIAAGADDIVSRENLRPRDLEEKIEAVLKLHRDNGYNVVEPIFCEVKDGKVRQVDPGRVARVQETMEKFAVTFDRHQRQTRHYAVMHAIWTSYQHHFGKQIVDLGCGTGHPMRQFIRDVMVPEFAAEPSMRGPTRILSVDNTEKMLVEARRGFQRLVTHNMNDIEGHLDMEFLYSDLLALNKGVLSARGFDQVDTVVASYLIHWANDKEGTVRMIADILERGGKFITVEEWPPLVKPGPHMPIELAKRIEETILPIERKEYYSMLRDHGLAELDGNVVVIKIDNHHKMYGNVFVKE